MSRQIRADRSKLFLFPEAFEDYIVETHPARFIAMVVPHLTVGLYEAGSGDPLARRSRVSASADGRPGYSDELLLSMWLYAYMFHIDGSRRLEMASYNDLGLIWLTSNIHPDHVTLSRFFTQHETALTQVFKKSVTIADKAGLVGLVMHAVDGTKIKSASSGRTGFYLDWCKKKLPKLDKSIAERVKAIKKNDASESNQGTLLLPEKLVKDMALAETVRSVIELMESEGRTSIHLNEPDAHSMPCGAETTFGYNGQAIADAKHGIVVAALVTTESNDVHQLVAMMESAKANLDGRTTETVADKGYAAGPIFTELEKKGLEATVALPKPFLPDAEKPFDAANFRYDAEKDVMVCPTGPILPFLAVLDTRGTKKRVYQCTVFATCPHRAQCSKSKSGRKVGLNENHRAIQKQRDKYASEAGQELVRKRGGLIEPVWARIKQHRGFRRWTLRGLAKVKAQWAIVNTAENLRIMYNLWKEGALDLGMAVSLS